MKWFEEKPTQTLAKAQSAQRRQTARRIAGDVAAFATARKLAALIYCMLRWGRLCVDEGAADFQNRHKEKRVKAVMSVANDHAYKMTLKASQA